MTSRGNLWAVGFDDAGQAEILRDAIARLGEEELDLKLLDMAVAVRYRDGPFTLNGDPFSAATPIRGGTVAHLLARISHQGSGIGLPCVS
jgi:hypothetical protein